MIEFITNKNNLTDNDITEVVDRVKILFLNSNNDIYLCHSHNNYHFPGGHVEDGESLIDAINREILEEVGVKLDLTEAEPFACSIGYWKDWPEEGKNRKTRVFYYEIKSEIVPDLNNINRTEHEKDGNFELKLIPLVNVENELISNRDKYGDPKGICREMLELMDIYRSIKA